MNKRLNKKKILNVFKNQIGTLLKDRVMFQQLFVTICYLMLFSILFPDTIGAINKYLGSDIAIFTGFTISIVILFFIMWALPSITSEEINHASYYGSLAMTSIITILLGLEVNAFLGLIGLTIGLTIYSKTLNNRPDNTWRGLLTVLTMFLVFIIGIILSGKVADSVEQKNSVEVFARYFLGTIAVVFFTIPKAFRDLFEK